MVWWRVIELENKSVSFKFQTLFKHYVEAPWETPLKQTLLSTEEYQENEETGARHFWFPEK